MYKPNAAEIMSYFLWNEDVAKILKTKMDKNGNVTVTQESQMEYLVKFLEFQEFLHEKRTKAENT